MNRIKLQTMMRKVLLLITLVVPAFPQQHKVDPGQIHERLTAIVPLQGSGTMADPKRPMFAPAKHPTTLAATKPAPRSTTDILAYSWQLSDDGKSAIVEFVASNRAAFAEILNSKDPKVKVFERDKKSKAETESEIKKEKKDFDPTKFGARIH